MKQPTAQPWVVVFRFSVPSSACVILGPRLCLGPHGPRGSASRVQIAALTYFTGDTAPGSGLTASIVRSSKYTVPIPVSASDKFTCPDAGT
jgi:hypothetical protein